MPLKATMAQTEKNPAERQLMQLGSEAQQVYQLLDSDAEDDSTPNQKVIHALLIKTCGDYAQSVTSYVLLNAGMVGTFILLTTVTFIAAISATYWLLRLIFGDCPNWIIYTFPFLILVAAWAMIDSVKDAKIELDITEGKLDGLKLGRLDSVFSYTSSVYVAFSVSALLTTQVAMLYFTDTHAGVDFDGSFWGCICITLDNVFRAIFLDVFELYEINVGGIRYEHDNFAAVVFLLYRLAYDAYFIAACYIVYRRVRMNNMFTSFPFPFGESKGQRVFKTGTLVEWLEELSRDKKKWHQDFSDEFIFLMMCEEYLRGDYALARKVSEQFPKLNVDSQLRSFFLDPEGNVVFQ